MNTMTTDSGRPLSVPGDGWKDASHRGKPAAEIGRRPVTVLHVEDDENLGASLGIFLRSYGHRVVTAGDGDCALEYIASGQVVPDVLIVDFMLPGNMDGAEVAQSICNVMRRPIPMIMLSAALSSASLPWLPGAPLLCLWKPVQPAILLKAVES